MKEANHDGSDLPELFTYQFGQRVKIRAPHPEAGATGPVTNAHLFRDGREEVFVSVPGGVGVYQVHELEPAPTHAIPRRPMPKGYTGRSTLSGASPNGSGAGRSTDVSGT